MNSGRVIVFSSEYPPHTLGGLGTHIENMMATLAEYLTIDLFVPAYGGYLETPSSVRLREVPVPVNLDGAAFWIEFARLAASAAFELSPTAQLIHAHDWMTALAGVKTRELLFRPLAFNVHLPQQFGSSLLIENIGLASADLVLVNSRSVQNELLSRGLTLGRTEVVPNGVDVTLFHPGEDWPHDEGYILFVGRLVPQKGVDTLLSAFSVLLRRCPASRLIIAGDGLQELYFRRLARFLGIPDRVSFVHWQTGQSLVHLYQRAQVVVIPSHYEPFGIVALEAMACGRPVVASRVGGLPDLIEHGVQGFLVASGDYMDLARRLAALVLDPQRRREMGQAALERVQHFTWKEVSKRIVELYGEIVGMQSYLCLNNETTSALWRQLFHKLDHPPEEITEHFLSTTEEM